MRLSGWNQIKVFAVAVGLLLVMPLWSQAIEDPIQTKNGQVQGYEAAPGVRGYRGIPFAAPPVGDLRWKAPQPPANWEGVRDATQPSAGCPQPRMPLMPSLNPKVMNEDCLYLNVWTPAKSVDEKLPVMMWIHGGAYTMGEGGGEMYDGTNLAKKGVILVSINYRLGPLGFFSHPALTKEDPNETSGNYGLLDQIAALEWIRDNIASFGGNPDQVTIFGESAGAGSVAWLMTSPKSKGLFHGAICQSGSSFGLARHRTETWFGLQPGEDQGLEIAKGLDATGDDVLDKLRALSADQVLAGFGDTTLNFFGNEIFRFGPMVDGKHFPEDPAEIFATGRMHPVPFIAGSNANEGIMFVTIMPPVRTPEAYADLVRVRFADYTDDLMGIYGADDQPAIKAQTARLLTDVAFVAPARSMVRGHGMARSESKAYLYHFTHSRTSGFGSQWGAFHGAEIPYVFNNLHLPITGGAEKDAPDVALSGALSTYWTNFAKTGNPNGEGVPEWPAYSKKADSHLEMKPDPAVGSHLRKEECDLIDTIFVDWRSRRNQLGSD